MTRLAIMSAVLVLAGCSGETPPPPPAAEPAAETPAEPGWVVSPSGVGSIQIGWTVAELNDHLGESLRPTYEVSDECDQLRPAKLPRGVSLMVILDTVMRVDVDLVVSVPGDTLSRIIFETDGQRVLNYRAGRRPAVELIEGCA